MTQRWLGGYITNNPTEPTSTVAKGVWTLSEQIVHEAAGNWPTTNKSPSDVSGLQFWVKSSDGITKDGSNNVSAWADQSGNGRNLSEATNQPLWVDAVLNSYPAIRFDGSNDKLATADWALSQPFHWFIVATPISSPGTNGFIVYGDNDTSSTTPPGVRLNSSSTIQMVGNTVIGPANAASNGTSYLIEALFNGTGSTLIVNAGAENTDADDLTASIDGVVLGARFSSLFANVDIFEVAIYNAAITDANLYGLRQYFRDRYAIF